MTTTSTAMAQEVETHHHKLASEITSILRKQGLNVNSSTETTVFDCLQQHDVEDDQHSGRSPGNSNR